MRVLEGLGSLVPMPEGAGCSLASPSLQQVLLSKGHCPNPARSTPVRASTWDAAARPAHLETPRTALQAAKPSRLHCAVVGCRNGIGARGSPKPWGVLATHRHRGQRKYGLPARRVLVSAPKHQPQGSFWSPPRGPTCTTTPRAELLGPEHVPRRWQGAKRSPAGSNVPPAHFCKAPSCNLLKKYITACSLARHGGLFCPQNTS